MPFPLQKTFLDRVRMKALVIAPVVFFLLLGGTRVDSAQPNIILILTDDQGWSQLSEPMDPRISEASSRYLETPNMVRLMNSGMRFSSGYSPAPLCTPTRRSILCGTSAARSGPEFPSKWVPADHVTIPKSLKAIDANYRCAHFGKWGEQMISTPEECGYDASDGLTGNVTGGMPNSLGVQGGHNDGPPHFIDNEDPKRTRSVTSNAIRFMTEQVGAKKPFYVQVSYYAQHLSVVTSQRLLDKYQAKGTPDRGYTEAWAGMMEELDDGIGQILNAVNELNIQGETYIFFTSDNGGRGTIPGGDEARLPPNTPLTGAKHSLYEGGIRVPFAVAGPGVAAGAVCRTPVVGYDFLPTFVDLAGGDTSTLPNEIDGVSFKQLLLKPDQTPAPLADRAVIHHRPDRLFSTIRKGDWKLILFWNRNGSASRHELYNLEASPDEEGHDIASEHPEESQRLKRNLTQYLNSVNADKPKPLKKKK